MSVIKGGYSTYSFLCSKLSKLVRKNYKQMGLRNRPSMDEALRFIFRENPSLVRTMDFTIQCEEYFWMKHSRAAIFPESVSVIEKLLKGKYEITDPAGISQPHNSYILSFPKGFEIAGQQARGAIVTWVKQCDREKVMLHPFMKHLKLPELPIIPDPDPEIQSNYTLTINYTSPNFKQAVNGEEGFVRATMPRKMIPDLLKCTSGQEYSELLGDLRYQVGDADNKLDRLDAEIQFQVFKIVAALGVYCSAFDGALVDGFPGKRPRFLEDKDIPQFRSSTLSMGTKDSPSAHYRTWHIRQLMHDKYYQGEHKHKEKGSRVVFVKESYVGHDIKAESLVEQ